MAANGLPDRGRSKPVVIHDRPELLEWVRRQPGFESSGPAHTIGIAQNGQIVAVFTYSNFRIPDIEIGLAAISKRWITRRVLREVTNYAWGIGCTRITATVNVSNVTVQRLLERLGFVQEGRKREAMPDGDELIYGLLKRDCFWRQNEFT